MPYRHTGIRSLRSARLLCLLCLTASLAAIQSRRRRSFNVHSALKSIEVAAAAAVANSEVCGREGGRASVRSTYDGGATPRRRDHRRQSVRERVCALRAGEGYPERKKEGIGAKEKRSGVIKVMILAGQRVRGRRRLCRREPKNKRLYAPPGPKNIVIWMDDRSVGRLREFAGAEEEEREEGG